MAAARSTKKKTSLGVTVVGDEAYRLIRNRGGHRAIDINVLNAMSRREMWAALIDTTNLLYVTRQALRARGVVVKLRPLTRRERENKRIRDAEERAWRAEQDAQLLAKARARGGYAEHAAAGGA